MIEEFNFETFLYVSKNEFQIFVFDKKGLKNVYNKKLKIHNSFNYDNFNSLSKFLEDNIYKVEKLVGNFIKDIILIIEDDKNLHINISTKKKNYDNSINQKYLENNLIELKDLFKKNYQEQTIMHMYIENYIIDGKKYYSFESNLINDYFCLEASFISIDDRLVFAFDKILEKFQIKISHYMCGNYIKRFIKEDNDEISFTAFKLLNGLNNKEVTIVPKYKENRGFFEKFFQLFS